MIEKTVLEYLQSHIEKPCYLEFPIKPPDSFVVIEKTGSSSINHIKGAIIAVQSYGKTLVEAISINEDVKTAMDGLTDIDEIGGCYLNSDYNFTDTATKRYRYQAVFDVTYY